MGVEIATKVITTYLDPQVMEVAFRSDFPWGRMGKVGVRACSADLVHSEQFWRGKEGCSSSRVVTYSPSAMYGAQTEARGEVMGGRTYKEGGFRMEIL